MSSPLRRPLLAALPLAGVAAAGIAAGLAVLLAGGGLPGAMGAPRHLAVCAIAVIVAIAGARRVPSDRPIWVAFGLGVSATTLGFTVSGLSEAAADGCYLVSYLFYWLGLWRILRRRVGDATKLFWFDAVGTMLWLGAVATLLTASTLLIDDPVTDARVALDSLYVAIDLALASVPLAIIARSGRGIGLQLQLLCAALIVAAGADATVALDHAGVLTVDGAWADLGWEVQLLLVAGAAWARPTAVGHLRIGGWWEWLPTAAWIALGAGVLLAGQWTDLPAVTVGFALATLAAAALRSALAVRSVGGMVIHREEVLTDDLTGLPNRRALFAELELLAATAVGPDVRAGLLILGLDGFRDLNDTLGHRSGDALLRAVAHRLEPAAAGAGGTLVRLGGDEFAVLLRDTGDPVAAAHTLRDALEQPLELDEVTVSVQASVGVARFPDDADQAGELARRADVAMTDAKRRGVGVARYTAERDANSVELLGLAADLRAALTGGGSGLWVAFQPQVDLADGRCTGVEALIRWSHPQRGPISPAELLPIAERSGQMPALTDWVLERALEELATLQTAGHALRVAVNVSARTLVDVALPDRIATALGEHGVGPASLVIEVTEDAVMSDQRRCLAVLERIAALGVEVAIDDFGTGQSSLAQLRHLPASELKIDRSFVQRMAADPLDAEVVRLVVTMGSRMGLRVVAEGIETPEEQRGLAQLGCHVGQGFGLGRPMPARELEAFLAGGGATARVAA